jgi:signal transduction histidine kinase
MSSTERTGVRDSQRLVAGLAHTANNALAVTAGNLELALHQVAAGSELGNELRTALACAYRAAGALRRFITFATAPASVPADSVSLREVANAAARVARCEASPRVSVVTRGDRPARVAARGPLLAAAVELIVANALEAMPEGGLLTLETDEASGRGHLHVRDTGPGLPAEAREHLFEPFVTTKSFGHLGLGLSLASELVRAQGGTLTVSSHAGRGTAVQFSFPALEPPADEAVSVIVREDDEQPCAPHRPSARIAMALGEHR